MIDNPNLHDEGVVLVLVPKQAHILDVAPDTEEFVRVAPHSFVKGIHFFAPLLEPKSPLLLLKN